MSNHQPQSDQRDTRKSKRQRKPNQYYTAGINELKKITLKGQSKKNKIQDGDDYSSGEERLNISSNYRNTQIYQQKYEAPSNSWLPCILPNNKYLKVQIVLDSANMEVAKVKEEYVKVTNEPLIFPTTSAPMIPKKTESGGTALNLLSLFQQAIQMVKQQPASNQKPFIIDQPLVKYQPQKKPSTIAPILPPPKRIIQEDKDGKILSVEVNRPQKLIRFNHSKMGIYEIPIDNESSITKQEQNSQQDLLKMDQWRATINANRSLLKSIDIYN